MGQSPNKTRQPPKAPAPVHPEGSVGGGAGGGEEPVDFCRMPHDVAVRLDSGAGATVGMEVALDLASPPRVSSGAREIGTVEDSLSRGLTRCLIDGYQMVGAIDSVDLEGRLARITISGVRPED